MILYKNFRDESQPSIEQHAFLEKLANYYPKLINYCYFLSRNKWDGEELAQETMLKAFQYYQGKQNLSGSLLKKIAYNEWIDVIRKRKRETIETTPESEAVLQSSLEETSYLIDKMVSCLTPKQTIIFILKEAFLFRISDLSNTLQMTEIAVKSVLYRARRQLEKQSTNDDRTKSSESYWGDFDKEEISRKIYHALSVYEPKALLEIISEIEKLSHIPDQHKLDTPVNKTLSYGINPTSHMSIAA